MVAILVVAVWALGTRGVVSIRKTFGVNGLWDRYIRVASGDICIEVMGEPKLGGCGEQASVLLRGVLSGLRRREDNRGWMAQWILLGTH